MCVCVCVCVYVHVCVRVCVCALVHVGVRIDVYVWERERELAISAFLCHKGILYNTSAEWPSPRLAMNLADGVRKGLSQCFVSGSEYSTNKLHYTHEHRYTSTLPL